ncbi:unknown [Prevotella sp. CAG:1031]|nr:unknown [Prevotella sp. CAG:1031]
MPGRRHSAVARRRNAGARGPSNGAQFSALALRSRRPELGGRSGFARKDVFRQPLRPSDVRQPVVAPLEAPELLDSARHLSRRPQRTDLCWRQRGFRLFRGRRTDPSARLPLSDADNQRTRHEFQRNMADPPRRQRSLVPERFQDDALRRPPDRRRRAQRQDNDIGRRRQPPHGRTDARRPRRSHAAPLRRHHRRRRAQRQAHRGHSSGPSGGRRHRYSLRRTLPPRHLRPSHADRQPRQPLPDRQPGLLRRLRRRQRNVCLRNGGQRRCHNVVARLAAHIY